MCLGKLGDIPYTLDEESQGQVFVSVQLGQAPPLCMFFGGTVIKDAGVGFPSPAGIFKAQNAPAPTADCPPLP